MVQPILRLSYTSCTNIVVSIYTKLYRKKLYQSEPDYKNIIDFNCIF